MGWCYVVCLLCCSFIFAYAEDLKDANESVNNTVFIDGKSSIGETDGDFICATIDWWPPEKCDYGTCSWDYSSMLNLDLNNIIFLNAIKAFSRLKIRLGGTLQDKVIYQTEDHLQPCIPFAQNMSELFNFTKGCLPLSRWDELNSFFNKSGALVVFGLNALNGRSIRSDNSTVGAWNSSNAVSLIRYTVKKGYNIYGWELGNELSGNGVGVHVAADQYASDTIVLHDLIQDIYKGVDVKPRIIAPGGFYEPSWFRRYIGVDEHLIEKILDPSYLDGEADVFRGLKNILRSSATSAVAWVGESGGAYNSGRNHVTNAFVFSFWYLDQLGMSSAFDTKTYCRQTLIGGNYGLLSTTTFVPNPDYYSALLWHRLMGRSVLSTIFSGTKKIRAYAHCAKQSQGITLLLINLDGNNTVEAKVNFNGTLVDRHEDRHHRHRSKVSKMHQANEARGTREEYHLTAMDGNIQSQTMLLNGKALITDSSGAIPLLEPITVTSSEPIRVASFSIAFVHMPYVALPACK
ncbi:heparanase-like protein 3 isoform X2 [Olea europaea var. sylvestris]|uniref:heparanase-like protein 3 isoform X2 n=1 Tax=Olea europaea var. sylvestris TaxID=158386 RepID=UPI000C1CD5E1|nr:heparanase-like protein 3 isoform X2 [Olea europaea var. sylvestris]